MVKIQARCPGISIRQLRQQNIKYFWPAELPGGLLQDEYRVRIVGQRGGGEGETVVTHCDTEPLVAHVQGPQSHPPRFEDTQHTPTGWLGLLASSLLLSLAGWLVVVGQQMVRDRPLVLPPHLGYDRPRLLHPPVDDQPPGRLGNDPVQQDQP